MICTVEEAQRKRCSVPGCSRLMSRHSAKGMCDAHYNRLRRGIPLEHPIQIRGNGWKSSHGYIYIGKRATHRKVMEKHLSRKLLYNEVIHHQDGNRENNNIANLELIQRGDHIRKHLKGKTNEERMKEKAMFGYCPVRLGGKP